MGIKTNELQRLEGVQGTDSILADTQEAGTGRLSFAQAAQFFDRELMRPGTAVERALSSKAELGRNSRNILINWDFRRPVNQNGGTRYTESGYTIDRWKIVNGGLSLGDDGAVSLLKNADTGTPRNCLFQLIDTPETYVGRTLTFSVLCKDLQGTLFATAYANKGGTADSGVTGASISSDGLASVTFTIAEDSAPTEFRVHWLLSPGGSCVPVAAKLELGERQTLARQVEGGWELIDPPDYALQYALCSQYSPITGEWVGSRHSNQNLLDNSYWMDKDTIVNQRGQESYSGPYKCYGIDRWYTSGVDTTVSVEDGYIRLTSSAATHQFRQEVEHGADRCRGRMVTFSILFEHESGADLKIGIFHGKTSWTYLKTQMLGTPAGISLASVTVKVPDGVEGSLGAYVEPNGIGTIKLYAAKLELGTVQTLAHKEGDAWALNDPPPDKALELAKCQRYQQKIRGTFAIGTNESGEFLDIIVPLPVSMRAVPSVTVSEIASVYLGGQAYAANGFGFRNTTGGGDRAHFGLRFACDPALPQKTAGIVGLLDCLLDANL